VLCLQTTRQALHLQATSGFRKQCLSIHMWPN
jgi:hypothetical protein